MCVCVYLHTHMCFLCERPPQNNLKKCETSLMQFWNISIVAARIQYTTQHFKRSMLSSSGCVFCVLWQWEHFNITPANIPHVTPFSKNDMVQLKLRKTCLFVLCECYWKCMTQKFSDCSAVLGTCGWYVNTGVITGDQYGTFWAPLLAEPANRKLS